MLAVDTNVVIRYLTRDDAKQAARAAAVIDGEQVFLPTSVILETEWVLRSLYRRSLSEICASLRTLAGQPTVTVENKTAFSTALDWAEQGMDLADAFHLSASSHCDAMITFDTDLVKVAKKLGVGPVRAP